jgi:hypothetical protein
MLGVRRTRVNQRNDPTVSGIRLLHTASLPRQAALNRCGPSNTLHFDDSGRNTLLCEPLDGAWKTPLRERVYSAGHHY